MSLARNTGINLAGSVLLIAVALATVPLYLRFVGIERYGVLSICWLLLGYLGLFDLGLSRGVTQWVASLRADQRAAINQVFWTGFATSAALGLIAFLVALPAGYAVMRFVHFDGPGIAGEAIAAVPWIACAVPVNMLGGINSGVLVGRSRFAAVNMIDVGSSIGATVAPLVVALLGHPQLPALVAASVCARALAGLVTFVVASRLVPLGMPTRPDRGLLGNLLAFGGWVTVSGIVGPILALWDRFVIGVMIGPRAVSVYVIPFSMIMRLLMVPEALNRALFPKLSGMSDEEASALAANAVAVLSIVMTPIVLVALLAAYPFLNLWVGHALAPEAVRITYLLIPGVWTNAFALTAFALLHAQRRAKTSAILHAAQVIPYVALLYLAIRFEGIAGAAFLWSARTAIDALLMFHYSSVGLRPLRALRIPAVIVGAATLAAAALPPGTMIQTVILFACLLAGGAAAYANATAEARQRLWALTSVLGRRSPA